MKRSLHKATAALVLMIMIVMIMVPTGIYADSTVANPTGGTFNETAANDGTVSGSVNVNLSNYYESIDKVTLPNNLVLSVSGKNTEKKATVTISGKAINHTADDSFSISIKFNTKKNSGGKGAKHNETKTFNIKFKDPEIPEMPQIPNDMSRFPIRVLEVYPNDISAAQGGTQDLLSYLGTDKTNYDITSISINKLISLKDEINGKYDVVYFGKGRYIRNAVNEFSYGNDITQLTANKLEKFIKSGQLCIFHSDAFKQDTIDSATNSKTILKSRFENLDKTYSNVKVVTDSNKENVIKSIKTTFANYNQRPILNVTEQPKTYRNENDISSNKLTFSYKVYDPDTPLGEELNVALYIDRNNDSIFDDADDKCEILYYKGTGENKYTTKVKNGQSGTITFNMPQGLTGVYFWKLVVTDSNSAKTEYEDVFKLKGNKIIVNVLQIKPDDKGYLSLTEQFGKTIPGSTKTYGKSDEYEIIVMKEMLVKDFNTAANNKTLQLNGVYDMIILGFRDNYTNDNGQLNTNAVMALEDFIGTGQSVMFTHDSIHHYYNSNITNAFVDDVGQVRTMGSNGKASGVWTAGLISWSNNSLLNDKTDTRYINTYDSSKTTTYGLTHYQNINPNSETNLVTPVNSSVITLYPFNLDIVPQNSKSVAKTHYQWFKLNLEDREVIPLFNLYKDANGRLNDDAMNNYYTYTRKNITYSGTGHKNETYPDFETKLFVNTAIKAYSGSNHAPEITVTEPKNVKIPAQDEFFNLVFSAYDFDYGNDILTYTITTDYNNDGVYEEVPGLKDIKMGNGKSIEKQMANKPDDVGPFRIKIRVVDEYGAASEKVLDLQKVEEPMITPTITVYNQAGSVIDKCLVNEEIKAKMTYKATGKTSETKEVTAKYNLTGKFDGEAGTRTYVTTANLEKIKFTSTAKPTPESIEKEKDIKVETAIPGKTTLTLTTKVNYNEINGVNESFEAEKILNVRNGQVEFYVVDAGGSPVKDAIIRDEAGNEIGKTNASGYLYTDGVVGIKEYSMVAPAGFTYDGNRTIYECDESGTRINPAVSQLNVTYDKYKWEVQFVVNIDMGINVTYYKANASKTALTEITPVAGVYTVKNPKNAPAIIVAKITVNPLASGDMSEMNFTLTTKNGETPIYTGDLAGVISALPVTFTGVPELAGLTQLKQNNSGPADGTFEGKSYYMVINVPKTNGQNIGLTQVNATIKYTSPSGVTTVPNNIIPLNGRVKFEEAATPILR